MFLVSEIELPEEQDAAAFVDFMRDEYIPAVETGSTRIGMVDGVQLLQGTTADTSHKFLWLVDWNGLEHEKAGAHVDEATSRKFEEFDASTTPQVAWNEVARRTRADTPSSS
jgi:hypothetical protein